MPRNAVVPVSREGVPRFDTADGVCFMVSPSSAKYRLCLEMLWDKECPPCTVQRLLNFSDELIACYGEGTELDITLGGTRAKKYDGVQSADSGWEIFLDENEPNTFKTYWLSDYKRWSFGTVMW